MFEIRKCEESDIPAVGAFYDALIYHLLQRINYPKWMYKIYPYESFVQEDVASHCQYACYNAGQVCGAFVLNEDPEGSYERGKWRYPLEQGQYQVIHAFGVDYHRNRQGIGSRMLRYCIHLAQTQGYRAIRLDVVPGNTPARKLYEKFGFLYAGEVDLDRGNTSFPTFGLYELNFS